MNAPFPEISCPRISLDGEEWEVSGVVSLLMPVTETGPMRGEVQRLFVSPWHRKKGVARMMMKRLEELAWEEGRWSLMLDTTVGTPAEGVYPRFGWRRGMVVVSFTTTYSEIDDRGCLWGLSCEGVLTGMNRKRMALAPKMEV